MNVHNKKTEIVYPKSENKIALPSSGETFDESN
jgi:hypothetical protein